MSPSERRRTRSNRTVKTLSDRGAAVPVVGPPTGTRTVVGAVGAVAVLVAAVLVASYPVLALVGGLVGVTAVVARRLARRRRDDTRTTTRSPGHEPAD